MKKIIAIFVCLVFMISLVISVSAATYYDYDLSVDYEMLDLDGAMYRIYMTGGLLTNVRGRTDISCANDQTGYASCTIWQLDGTSYSSSGTEKDFMGWVQSGKAKGTENYAASMNHYGRRYTGSNTEYFQCHIYGEEY